MYCRAISRVEFEQKFVAYFARILRSPNDFSLYEASTSPADAFASMGWKIVPIPSSLCGGIATDPSELFDDARRIDPFDCLFATLNSLGIRRIILSHAPMDAPTNQPACECAPDRLSVDQAYKLLLPVEIRATSEECTWGLVSPTDSESWTMVGGNQQFIDTLIKFSGGLESIKRRFWLFFRVMNGLPVESDTLWCQQWRAFGWGDVPKKWPRNWGPRPAVPKGHRDLVDF